MMLYSSIGLALRCIRIILPGRIDKHNSNYTNVVWRRRRGRRRRFGVGGASTRFRWIKWFLTVPNLCSCVYASHIVRFFFLHEFTKFVGYSVVWVSIVVVVWGNDAAGDCASRIYLRMCKMGLLRFRSLGCSPVYNADLLAFLTNTFGDFFDFRPSSFGVKATS